MSRNLYTGGTSIATSVGAEVSDTGTLSEDLGKHSDCEFSVFQSQAQAKIKSLQKKNHKYCDA